MKTGTIKALAGTTLALAGLASSQISFAQTSGPADSVRFSGRASGGVNLSTVIKTEAPPTAGATTTAAMFAKMAGQTISGTPYLADGSCGVINWTVAFNAAGNSALVNLCQPTWLYGGTPACLEMTLTPDTVNGSGNIKGFIGVFSSSNIYITVSASPIGIRFSAQGYVKDAGILGQPSTTRTCSIPAFEYNAY